MTDYKKAFENNKELSLKEGDNLRKSTIYICEGCGVDYTTAEEAEECEKSHVKPVKIVKGNYEYTLLQGLNLPVSVTVKFENGMEREYFAKGRV